ncbi:N-alpha-acetyltransferase 30 isoform X2 [Colossoma macropomum]|uniref:N-alpha-acetyltransferase 30 isoform X2 n=1 Tax=Colossoma macropomum TaxID=42526 RepID=UPI001864B1E1|nr:N-alpha-acetyltransferase 30 isoform X2 [Colossoma macropomum]
MAEVPPGPNALSASPAEIIPLPVDGCSFLGNNEKLDRGRGDVIALGTEPQQATEPRGIIKTKQNNVHPNSSLTQLNGVGEHTEEEEEEDGEHCSRVSVSNHVPHPAHRAAVSERLDGERSASVLTNNECENRTVPNNEVSTAAISENSSDEPECDNSTCSGTVNSRTVGNLSLAEAGGEGQELAADDGSKGRAVEEEAPVAQMANLSLTEEQTGDSAISTSSTTGHSSAFWLWWRKTVSVPLCASWTCTRRCSGGATLPCLLWTPNFAGKALVLTLLKRQSMPWWMGTVMRWCWRQKSPTNPP